MNELKEIFVEKADGFEKLLVSVNARTRIAWESLVGCLRNRYVRDELWDDKGVLKFCRSGKTLVALYLKQDKVTAPVIFGKAERDKFEICNDNFSSYIQGYYDNSKTFHDGKWMFIDSFDLETADVGLASKLIDGYYPFRLCTGDKTIGFAVRVCGKFGRFTELDISPDKTSSRKLQH